MCSGKICINNLNWAMIRFVVFSWSRLVDSDVEVTHNRSQQSCRNPSSNNAKFISIARVSFWIKPNGQGRREVGWLTSNNVGLLRYLFQQFAHINLVTLDEMENSDLGCRVGGDHPVNDISQAVRSVIMTNIGFGHVTERWLTEWKGLWFLVAGGYGWDGRLCALRRVGAG